MTLTRPAAVLATLATCLALTACGSDDGGSGGNGGGDGGDGGEEVSGVQLQQGESCEAEVSLTGAVEQEWSGEASVSTSESDVAPPATYQAADGDTVLTTSAPGHGFEAITLITSGDRSFGVPTDDPGIEAADDGSGATVSATATDVAGGDTVQVEATFTC
ncbi:hypothetical protein GCM10023340_17670 [Nocardioides marinquilinus]|uniref:Lipoprotein antigen n=1 Tax=Nocardioides marinquilinus TaxID=1210400 RepID=A0ABP9PKZ7_9ACTN